MMTDWLSRKEYIAVLLLEYEWVEIIEENNLLSGVKNEVIIKNCN
jgi:hypothetical protein